jgi:Domain of unknown function (DUF4189)
MKKKYLLPIICALAALITAFPLLTTRAADKTTYGAIAYSMKSKQQGVGAGDTKSEAKKNALKFCEAKDCEVLVEYQNDCGALAVSKDGYYGAGEGKDKAEAEANAMKFCKEKGKDCEAVVSDCTSDK